jgi:hypothetical protein
MDPTLREALKTPPLVRLRTCPVDAGAVNPRGASRRRPASFVERRPVGWPCSSWAEREGMASTLRTLVEH